MNLRTRASLFSLTYLPLFAVVLPWAFAHWLGWGPTAGSIVTGSLLAIAGFGLSAWCVNFFVTRGKGTQSPVDPPKRLVIAGPYRYVRNPMIAGNLLLLVGESVVFRSLGILLYTALFWVAWHVILIRGEEPSLRRRFGAEYETYQREVPRWLPRFSRTAP